MNQRKFLIGTTTVLILIVFTLLLAELSLQAVFYIKNGYPLWSGHKNYTVGYVTPTDDPRQYTLKPGFSDGKIQINQQGFRGESIPDNDSLICVIGDSVPFGSGVSNGETFPDFLDKNSVVQKNRLRVLNGGVPSYNLVQSLSAWRLALKDRKCKFLIVNAANDISLLDYYQSDWSLDKTWASARFNIDKERFSAIAYYIEKAFKGRDKADSLTMGRNINEILKRLEADISEVVANGTKIILMPIQPCYYKTLARNSSHSASACKGYPEYEKLAKSWDPLISELNSGLSKIANNQTVFFFDSTGGLENDYFKDDAFVDFIHYSVSGNKHIANDLVDFILNKKGIYR